MFSPIIRFVAMVHLSLQDSAKSRDEEGAAAVEYGLLIALIAVAIVAAVTLLGTTLSDLFDNVTSKL